MNIYTRLSVISGLDNITKSNINYSIKQHITRLWVEDGMPILDYEFSLRDNVIFWAKSWFNTLSLNMKEWLMNRLDILEAHKQDSEGCLSFPKFLWYQLGDGYIFKNIDSLQFSSSFDKKEEVAGYIIQVLSELSINADLYFDDISYHEIVTVVADILLYRTFSEYIRVAGTNIGKDVHVNEGKAVHTHESEDAQVSVYFERIGDLSLTHEKFTSLLSNVVADIISPLGRNREIVKEYAFIFEKLNGGKFTIQDELNVFNRVSYSVVGMDLRVQPEEFGFSSGIEQDLVTYFIDVMIRHCIFGQLEVYKDPKKVEEIFGYFRSEALKKLFFDHVINMDESAAIINEPIKDINVRGYYSRYNLDFDTAPQYYNYSLYTMAFVYTDSRYVTSNVEDFSNRQILKHYDDYIRWSVYRAWLQSLDQLRGRYDSDIYQLIPQNLDTLDEVTEIIRKLVETNAFTDSKIYNTNQINEAFDAKPKPFKDLERLDHYNYVLTTLDARLQGAKYKWFDTNRLVEVLKDGSTVVKYNYRYRFYKYVMEFLNTFDRDKLEEYVSDFNTFYASLNTLKTYSPYADPNVKEVTVNVTPLVESLKVGYTQVLTIDTNADVMVIESENPEFLEYNEEDNSIKAIAIGLATLTIRASYGTKLSRIVKYKIDVVENTDERDSWIDRFVEIEDQEIYKDFLYNIIKPFEDQKVEDMVNVLEWTEDLKLNNFLKPSSINLADFIVNDEDDFYKPLTNEVADQYISQVKLLDNIKDNLLTKTTQVANPFFYANYPYVLKYLDFIQDNDITEVRTQSEDSDTEESEENVIVLDKTNRYNYIRCKLYTIFKLNPSLAEFINTSSKDEVLELIDRHEMKVVREYLEQNHPHLYDYLVYYYWFIEYKARGYQIDIDKLITIVNRKMRSYYENKDVVPLATLETELATPELRADMPKYKAFKSDIELLHLNKEDSRWLNKALFDLDIFEFSQFRIEYSTYKNLLDILTNVSNMPIILTTPEFQEELLDISALNLNAYPERKQELLLKYPLLEKKLWKEKYFHLLNILKMTNAEKWEMYCNNLLGNTQYKNYLNIKTVIEFKLTSNSILNFKHIEFYDDRSRTWRVKYCEPNKDIYHEFNKCHKCVLTPHQGTSFTSINNIPNNYKLDVDEVFMLMISNSTTTSDTNGFRHLFVRSDSGTYKSIERKYHNDDIYLTFVIPDAHVVSMTMATDTTSQTFEVTRYLYNDDNTISVKSLNETSIQTSSNKVLVFESDEEQE